MKIVIISASVRIDRRSHRVALYFQRFITENNLASIDLLDLKEFNFPVFDERLQYMKNPTSKVLEFAERVKAADAILIVTPEYNGGYPASLKNVIDLLYPELKRTPIAIATVSDGMFGGSQVITSLLFSLWKVGGWVAPAMFPVPKVQEHYDEQGNPTDKAGVDKRANIFIGELIWCATAKKKMQE
jgi:NAD(P)H-dependent FMN reductase